MSARDIIQEIPALSDHDLKLVENALRERRARDAAMDAAVAGHEKQPGRKMAPEEAMDYVFNNFDGLLRRLAQ